MEELVSTILAFFRKGATRFIAFSSTKRLAASVGNSCFVMIGVDVAARLESANFRVSTTPLLTEGADYTIITAVKTE